MARLKDRLAHAAESGVVAEALLKEGGERFARIPIESIEPDPDQPRKSIGNLEDLKASIGDHGIIQPIVVSPHGSEMFRIIAGERRFSAAKELGLKTVPAIIRTVETHRRLEMQLVENIHRQELSPVEEAEAYRRLIEEFQLSQRELAKRLGRSLSAVNETLRILSLPEPILESVRTSEHLSRSVLLEIAKQEDEELRDAMWQSALAGNLTVKTARRHKPADGDPAPSKPRTTVPFKTRDATVTVVFPRDQATPADIVDALSQALKEARAILRESGPAADPEASD
jgi:ParB family chromosome partitioning protein